MIPFSAFQLFLVLLIQPAVPEISSDDLTETAEEMTVKTINPVLDALETLDAVETALKGRKDRSAWNKGVTVYALELVESYDYSYMEGGKERA